MTAESDRPPSLRLVSCVSQKLNHAAAAELLYTSTWFRKARAYVSARSVPWRILSAKHRLLTPSTVIEPYDVALTRTPIAQRRDWAIRVVKELREFVREGAIIEVFAGAPYRQFLKPMLEAHRINVRLPLLGLGIGRQLNWFNRQDVEKNGSLLG